MCSPCILSEYILSSLHVHRVMKISAPSTARTPLNSADRTGTRYNDDQT